MKNKSAFSLVLVFTILSCVDHTKNSIVTTYAGNGAMGSLNGKRLEASFSNLMDISIDAKGNFYVADSRNNLIRKINPGGMVTTLAGSGKAGCADGKGIAASFFYPTALAVDKKGNVWVADTHNNLIRKISPDGVVTTIAGKADLTFDNPGGIAVDASGNVFVSDWHDQIRKISPEGNVSNFAGNGERGVLNGIGSKASFYIPQGLAVDRYGNIFVVDSYNNQIRKITPAGEVLGFAGTVKKGSTNGPVDSASFFHPHGIAIDRNGNIFVTDTGNNLIRKIGTDHRITTLAGTGARGAINGSVEAATFWRPAGVAVDSAGNVYVADYQNNLIRKISH